jgi:hypothetical protein
MYIHVGYSAILYSLKLQKNQSDKSSGYPRPKNVEMTSRSSLNPPDQKIDLVTEGLRPFYRKC